jgi:RNA polymerase sigma factor (sigma-70 family)
MTPSGIFDDTSIEPKQSMERRGGPEPSRPKPSRARSAAAAKAERPGGSLWEVAGREFLAWRSGEPDALERLVRRVTPTLWQLARAHRLNDAAAEDVVQATWLLLVRRADSVRDGHAVLGWLTMTARREAWRASKAQQQEDSFEPGVLDAAVPAQEGVDGQVIADDEARTLWRQVARLSERCRRLLRTIAFDDRPDYRKISVELDMPHGSIGPTRRRCLGKLRELLANDVEWST